MGGLGTPTFGLSQMLFTLWSSVLNGVGGGKLQSCQLPGPGEKSRSSIQQRLRNERKLQVEQLRMQKTNTCSTQLRSRSEERRDCDCMVNATSGHVEMELS